MASLMLVAIAFWGSVLGGAFYLGLRYVRAVERRGTQDLAVADLQARIAALEEASDTLRSDVERLETGQEFTTRLLHRGPGSGSPPT